jgi:lia operon protein LiaG
MKLTHRLTMAAVFVVALAGTGWAGPNETERVHTVIPLQPGGTLKLETFSGRVVITGSDASEVVIDAVRRAPKDRLERVKLDIEASGTTVRIQANRRDSSWFNWGNNVVDTDFDIKVPRKTDIDVSAFSSGVRIASVSGSHRVHSFSGSVHLDDVAGPIKADTFSGSIEIQMAAAADQPELDLHTFSGSVDVRVPETARAQVDFNSFSGDLNSDVPLVLKSQNRHSLRAELSGGGKAGGASNNVRVKTFSGDVRFRK